MAEFSLAFMPALARTAAAEECGHLGEIERAQCHARQAAQSGDAAPCSRIEADADREACYGAVARSSGKDVCGTLNDSARHDCALQSQIGQAEQSERAEQARQVQEERQRQEEQLAQQQEQIDLLKEQVAQYQEGQRQLTQQLEQQRQLLAQQVAEQRKLQELLAQDHPATPTPEGEAQGAPSAQ